MKITLYVSTDQTPTWDEARRRAAAAGTSLSQLATDALDAHIVRTRTQTPRQRQQAGRLQEQLRLMLLTMADEIDAATEKEEKQKAGKRTTKPKGR